MQNYTAKTETNSWKNHEDDPMEQMRRALLSKDNEIQHLKRSIADEVKEKYSLYKRVKELNEEIEKLKNSL
mgnify:CR=1 FL=1|tara:strand:+ start:320 stop:532 length:213 start_codon:yes stop_codon:yes gene_type:complete